MPTTADALRALERGLAPHASVDGVGVLLQRLERDLLPRTAGGDDHLVVGLVGPNNSGKSALFNAIVGGATEPGAPAAPVVSPSLPTGGATRRLVGAATPHLRAVLEGETTLERFALRGATPGPGGIETATHSHEPGRAHELLLAEVTTLPDSLLVVDTPDFDSVREENRAVTDALLTVVDVAIAVVTRHTYQNREVVEFLRRWLEHGRPWVLVYNESIDDEVSAKHAAKLESDIGAAPEGVFTAPFDPEVAAGRAALVPTRLGGGDSLAAWLRALGDAGDLKERALAASLDALESDMAALALRLRDDAARAEEVERLARGRAQSLAASVAREAMPMGPFLEAFREVLDERPSRVQRELRRGAKWTSRTVASGARWAARNVLGRAEAAPKATVEETLLEAERRQLQARWGDTFEDAVSALRRTLADGDVPPAVAEALERRFRGPEAVSPGDALDEAVAALGIEPELLERYEEGCRRLIEAELDADGSNEWLMQIGIDALHLLPLGIASAVIVHTGGLGADVVVAGGGALSTAAAERLSRTLGTAVASAARQRWIALREGRLAEAAARGILGAEVTARIDEARANSAGLALLLQSPLRGSDNPLGAA